MYGPIRLGAHFLDKHDHWYPFEDALDNQGCECSIYCHDITPSHEDLSLSRIEAFGNSFWGACIGFGESRVG